MSDPAALEAIAERYRAAYLAHDPSLAPISRHARFSENNVALPFPDGTWDTVAEELGPALTLVDTRQDSIGIFTAIRMHDVTGYLAVRLGVAEGEIVEIEHLFSTPRNLSGPPTPIGPVEEFAHDPDLVRPVAADERMTRDALIAAANGYFETLQNNTGDIRGTAFSADCTRIENGKSYPEVEKLFRLGRYRFNERVRDRAFLVIDEPRGLVMARGFIDHKGVMDDYALTDGTAMRSLFREPHSWSLLELFKVKAGRITAVEATFIAVPYYMPSPWNPAQRWPAQPHEG
ncbi:hypothetical protein [Novosphingobium pentaromativorans]|uniref:DUF8021 domain-containing protein n=1 Tax=Novosphingobium pentaromativorans US6-1 TaxID=1088721 RepID=G6EB81_9SPHN|nr:hypothetical protein [Novosphingobium pentaromativorans]AIT80470.1 hypothetical protein JI59_12095 [Novosphingobium pentaromativorans US6-1]EHJ61440.1 hypothetical protein NSU_1602 [Novosphingobium pentaromativorans US6-1]